MIHDINNPLQVILFVQVLQATNGWGLDRISVLRIIANDAK
jgi:hypothetical protein